MSRRVFFRGEVKDYEVRSRRETESEEGVESRGKDPKPDDLSMARLKIG
jgi:hypothetical protein